MHIQFSRILMLPVLIAIIVLVYVILQRDWIYLSIYVAGLIVLLVLMFIFSPQLDWWWWEKKPPTLPQATLQLFYSYKPGLANLDQTLQKKLSDRIALFILGKDFEFPDLDTSPHDIKSLIAFYAALLTLEDQNYLLDPWDKIVLFRNKFLSPDNQAPHASELHQEDRVVVFSIQHLAAGFRHPQEHFEIGLYELMRIYISLFQIENFNKPTESDCKMWKEKGFWYPEKITRNYGYNQVDPYVLALCNWVAFGEQFDQNFPEEAMEIKKKWPQLIPLRPVIR